MITYKKPDQRDYQLANEFYLNYGLREFFKKHKFLIRDKTGQEFMEKNKYSFVAEHPKFVGDHDNHFQIVFSRGMSAEIYPPVRITIWVTNDDIIFQQTLDLQTTNVETIIYIIEKLMADFC